MKTPIKPYLLFIVLIILGILFPQFAYGQNRTDLFEDYEIWIDSFNQFKAFENIDGQAFQTHSNFDFGDTKHAYWLRLRIQNPSSELKKYWLQVGVFDSITLAQKVNGHFDIRNRGLLIDYDQPQKQSFQSLQQNKYGFEILMAANTQEAFFLRIKNTVRFENTIANIQLLNKEENFIIAGKQSIYFSFFSAAFFGILLFFIIFSLFQYFQNKDLSYLYYSIYLSLNFLYFWWKFEKSNSFFNVLFTNNPEAYYYYGVPFGMLIYISYFLFIVTFLNAKKDLPVFYNTLKIATYAALIYLVFNIAIAYINGLDTSWELNYWMRFILIPFSVITIYQVFKNKHQLGFYILTGTLIMLVGAAITTVFSKTLTQHYVGPWDIPLLPIQIGILIEVLFFSAGLAYKSRLIVQENTAILLDLKQRQIESNFHKNQKEKLTQLYTNLSHEFRTPLTIILGMLRQIKGHQEAKKMIRRNGNQLLDLTNQVLDLNKLEAYKMDINWTQGDVMSFIRYCSESFEQMAKNGAKKFSIFCAPNQLIMDFDVEKLQKIINNLIVNAIKFTPKGGQIRIDAYKDEKGKQPLLRIDISDSGKGIPPEYHQSIFDHYTQLPGTDGGTGIGLALVKELTLLLGGKIELDSALQKGSIFKLSFPIHNEAKLEPNWTNFEKEVLNENSKATQLIELIVGRPSVLLVEDNADVQYYLKQILKSQYNCFVANNGKQGLEMLKDIYPDIIISDVMMPEMDGYEFCQKVKENHIFQHIPIILLTAKASQPDKLNGLKCKADAYLTKPFDEEELLLRIEQLLEQNSTLKSRSEDVHRKNGLLEKEENEAVVFMDKFHETLNKHLLDESFTIEDLANKMGQNHVYINNKIKKHRRQTTAQYIRYYRLNLAKKLLQTTQLTIAEISYKVGVPEPANFSNMFKKAFGSSPGQWRKGVFRDL